MDALSEPLWLEHPKEIRFGVGRIVYDPYPKDGLPGWRLPGRGVTSDVTVAAEAARWIDTNARAARGYPSR